MSGWQSVLDIQLDLYRFWRSEYGAGEGRAYGDSMMRVAKEVGGPERIESEAFFAENLVRVEAVKCRDCEPIYVAPDMMDLVEFAVKTFEPEPFERTDLITLAGFLVLPRPLFMRDRHGMTVSYRIICWYPAVAERNPTQPFHETRWSGPNAAPNPEVDGVHLSLYSHDEDPDDWYDKEMAETGATFGEMLEHRRSLAGTHYGLCHLTPWRFGQAVPSAENIEHTVVSEDGWWRSVQCLLRLMMQTIATRDHEDPPRAARKRAAKDGHRPTVERPYVTVVRLRRPKAAPSGDHHKVEWDHQWIVSGHWRNQYFPSIKGHRQIWISPYVKGPEDKPLVVRKAHAFEFVK